MVRCCTGFWKRYRSELFPQKVHQITVFKGVFIFAGIKLDFKALESVGLSLDLLKQKESNKGINRPVWLNADILRGPNVPSFVAPVNGSRYEVQLDRTQTLGQSSELGRENV